MYADAKEKCKSLVGYDLASVLSTEETHFLGNMTVKINPAIGERTFNFPWIGLHRDTFANNGILFIEHTIAWYLFYTYLIIRNFSFVLIVLLHFFLSNHLHGYEGTWVWVDGFPINYTNWNVNEPSNHEVFQII